ncbi:hypothetical protein Nepgr_000085 [Nepenthes gracilis]|uniref:Cytochrome P450 n=1 Tax=Nepenthes gracilis TaxID=150966 RepID=A0AAD3P2R5_NEPGR|nr:hypothetical protein Nepgr_000085 [Nepenthes gracilis]
MEAWFIIVASLSIAALVKAVFDLSGKRKGTGKGLPPGPASVPVVGRLLWLIKPLPELESILSTLRSKFGPIVTLRFGSRISIFIFKRSLAHQALVQNGAVFASRPKAPPTTKILSSNQHNINSSAYGPTWRLLRRNITSEILHPSRVKSYSHARRWVLDILLNRLVLDSQSHTAAPAAVKVIDHFRYAMFCLLALMCFGDKLDENQIRQIETVHRGLLLSLRRFQVLNFWPQLTKILLRRRWLELFNMRKDQEEVIIPLIRARKQAKMNHHQTEKKDDTRVVSYVDTLLELELEEEEDDGIGKKKRNLTEKEMVSICSEFMNAGTDTTSTALQWIMANLVKYPDIQAKLFQEIRSAIGEEAEEVGEEDLAKMPYLKAVILEGLRRHPPGHFVLPHAVTRDVEIEGYTVPKDAIVNFMVAELGWDAEMWEDPMGFKPERFLNEGGEEFDITGTREIKMMPFGVGRRMCPGSGLALLHLEYFVANLILKFQWTVVNGGDVDLSEKQEFTVVMKNPLRAQISPRPAK